MIVDTLPKIVVHIPDTIRTADPSLANDMEEASRFLAVNLHRSEDERDADKYELCWALEATVENPVVRVEYHEGGECRQSAAPPRRIFLNMPVSQFRNRIGRHDLMYRLLHAVNDLRLDRVMDRLGNLIRETEQIEEANRGHTH